MTNYPEISLKVYDSKKKLTKEIKDKCREITSKFKLKVGTYTLEASVASKVSRLNKDIVFSSYGVDKVIFGKVY